MLPKVYDVWLWSNFINTSFELSRSLHIPTSLNEGFTRSVLNGCCLEVRSRDKFFWSMLFNNIMLLGNINAGVRNMTKMLYLRFHDKISAIIQYLYGIIIHFANIFNIQNSLLQPPTYSATRLPGPRLQKLMICLYLNWRTDVVNRNNNLMLLAGDK